MRDLRGAAPYVLWTAAICTPCLWLPGIYGGDLSSHLYNAWLAQLIGSGQGQGLVLASQFTNVLFDRLLELLLPLFGSTAAGRIAVTLSVTVFGWGAFAFASVVSHSRPWRVMPVILMLAHGWVLQIGFMNFYLSLGLCFWAMALVWRSSRPRLAAAVGLLCIAWTAHALPVVWSMSMLAYVWVGRRFSNRARLQLLAGALASIVLLKIALTLRFTTQWLIAQLLSSLGADQVLVFGPAFGIVAVALVALSLRPVARLFSQTPAKALAESFPAQVCILTSSAVALIPTGVMLPGYRLALTFIADRMSLAVAVCVCALLATLPWRRVEQAGLAAAAIVFFSLLYPDQRAVGGFENRMELALAPLPPGRRVLGAFNDPSSRINAFTHLIDRACIGHCFSYGNYEPSTDAFRVRANSPNPVVAFRYEDSFNLQNGSYVVNNQDLPLTELIAGERGFRFELHDLKQGEKTHSSELRLPF
jgi:hypothetical protein